MSTAAKRSNNRNEALLDAAAELFSTQGFRETTMRDIAKAAGMLPGSIYYHHGSKDDLLLAVYAAGVDRIVDELDQPRQPQMSPGTLSLFLGRRSLHRSAPIAKTRKTRQSLLFSYDREPGMVFPPETRRRLTSGSPEPFYGAPKPAG